MLIFVSNFNIYVLTTTSLLYYSILYYVVILYNIISYHTLRYIILYHITLLKCLNEIHYLRIRMVTILTKSISIMMVTCNLKANGRICMISLHCLQSFYRQIFLKKLNNSKEMDYVVCKEVTFHKIIIQYVFFFMIIIWEAKIQVYSVYFPFLSSSSQLKYNYKQL